MPSTASRKAVPRNSGARNSRSLAEIVSRKASAAPPASSFSDHGQQRQRQRGESPCFGDAPGQEQGDAEG